MESESDSLQVCTIPEGSKSGESDQTIKFNTINNEIIETQNSIPHNMLIERQIKFSEFKTPVKETSQESVSFQDIESDGIYVLSSNTDRLNSKESEINNINSSVKKKYYNPKIYTRNRHIRIEESGYEEHDSELSTPNYEYSKEYVTDSNYNYEAQSGDEEYDSIFNNELDNNKSTIYFEVENSKISRTHSKRSHSKKNSSGRLLQNMNS